MTVNLSFIFIYPLLGLSLLVGLSSSNSFTLWLMLEINTVLFISIIFLIPGGKKTSALVKYFTVQALSSMLFIYTNVALLSMSNFSMTVSLLALMLKLGMAPMHLWYLSVLQDLNWMSILILSTVQKLLPLFFISSLMAFTEILLVSLFSSFAGIWALGASSLKRLVGYSSVLNMGWGLLSTLAISVFLQFFLTYLTAMMGLLSYFSYFMSEKVSDLKKLSSFSDVVSVCVLILSLSAFPPLLGFWAKLFILKLVVEASFVLTVWLLINTVFMVYTYITLLDILLLSLKNYSISSKKFSGTSGSGPAFFLGVSGLCFMI